MTVGQGVLAVGYVQLGGLGVEVLEEIEGEGVVDEVVENKLVDEHTVEEESMDEKPVDVQLVEELLAADMEALVADVAIVESPLKTLLRRMLEDDELEGKSELLEGFGLVEVRQLANSEESRLEVLQNVVKPALEASETVRGFWDTEAVHGEVEMHPDIVVILDVNDVVSKHLVLEVVVIRVLVVIEMLVFVLEDVVVGSLVYFVMGPVVILVVNCSDVVLPGTTT